MGCPYETMGSGTLGIVDMFNWIRLLRSAVADRRGADEREARRRARERQEVAAFCAKVIVPALQDLQQGWERQGRKASICRDGTIFHITVWHERLVEFQYSIAACRRKRRKRRIDYVHPEAMTYEVDVQRVYALGEIRKTGRQKFAKQITAEYQQAARRVAGLSILGNTHRHRAGDGLAFPNPPFTA